MRMRLLAIGIAVSSWACGPDCNKLANNIQSAASAYAAGLSAFLSTDPTVTNACNSFLQAGCSLGGMPVSCHCHGPPICSQQQCVFGTCQ